MKVDETNLLKFMNGPKQFLIPIYQRTYSWTLKECKQLWSDIIKVGKDESITRHFIGFIVCIEKALYQISAIPKFLVIDGQQRLTTISLLLSALCKAIEQKRGIGEINSEKLKNYYLINKEGEGELRYKLVLTKSDKETLFKIIDSKKLSEEEDAQRLTDNYKFFEDQIAKSDIKGVYQGIAKLFLIDVSLNRERDNPQLIFESLNSTGLKLTQADLIRNYILMGLIREEQKESYRNFQCPIEKSFDHAEYSKIFDRFMRDHLTSIFSNINPLKLDVPYPFLLEVYEDYKQNIIDEEDILNILKYVESYVFRRSICGIPANSLDKTFATLYNEIKKENYLESFKAALLLKESYRRFPRDKEFKQKLSIKDVYNFRNRNYLLRKLENYDKKKTVSIERYTIEHVMPQKEDLSDEWKEELGEKWMEIHDKYLHTLGNLTFISYNPELSFKPFKEKKDMKGGFADSPLRLNSSLAKLEHWNEQEILNRASTLIEFAVKVWPCPEITDKTLKKYKKLTKPNLKDKPKRVFY